VIGEMGQLLRPKRRSGHAVRDKDALMKMIAGRPRDPDYRKQFAHHNSQWIGGGRRADSRDSRAADIAAGTSPAGFKMTEEKRHELGKKGWGIEVYHPALKQCSGV
jgi:hypothetical protein